MRIVDHGIAQFVVLIAEFQHRALQLRALRQAQALGKRTGGDVAHDHFQGHDGHFLHQRFPGGKLLHVVRGNALGFQHAHQVIGHAVVDLALAGDGALFEAVESGRVVLIIHNVQIFVRRGEYFFGLALIQLLRFFHGNHNPLSLFKLRAHRAILFGDLLLHFLAHAGKFLRQARVAQRQNLRAQ